MAKILTRGRENHGFMTNLFFLLPSRFRDAIILNLTPWLPCLALLLHNAMQPAPENARCRYYT